ncbi:MAG: heptose kinase [Pseudomonadales bacterium]|nr:heptose kinase [Pseudomonadales bacterium]
MSEFWKVTNEYKNSPIARYFSDLAMAYELRGQLVSKDPRSQVQKCHFEGRHFYVKQYHASGKYLRKYLGASRVRTEWENLVLFRQWGIPVPKVVAYGEEKCFGKFVRGVLVTEELENSMDMESLVRQSPELFADRDWFFSLIKKLARHVRTIHQHRFAHNDLDWRNILVVNDNNQPELFFFDSPAGRFWWLSPLLEYRVVKDLAHLDKVARQFLSPQQRLRFYYLYTGASRLSKADKKRVRKILNYYDS